MSTRMTEADWTHTLEVFRACLPRRGRKAVDDRLFLEAMHFSPWRLCAGGPCRSASAIGTASGGGSIA